MSQIRQRTPLHLESTILFLRDDTAPPRAFLGMHIRVQALSRGARAGARLGRQQALLEAQPQALLRQEMLLLNMGTREILSADKALLRQEDLKLPPHLYHPL